MPGPVKQNCLTSFYMGRWRIGGKRLYMPLRSLIEGKKWVSSCSKSRIPCWFTAPCKLSCSTQLNCCCGPLPVCLLPGNLQHLWMTRHFGPATSQRLSSESGFWQLLEPRDFRVVHRAGSHPSKFVPVLLCPFLGRKSLLPLTSPPYFMEICTYSSAFLLNWKLIYIQTNQAPWLTSHIHTTFSYRAEVSWASKGTNTHTSPPCCSSSICAKASGFVPLCYFTFVVDETWCFGRVKLR